MRLGVPYKGSKNAIAGEIIEQLPPAEVFVDLFCGGGAITHAAMLSGKYKRFIMNDIEEAPVKLFRQAINGEFKNEKRWISREDFSNSKIKNLMLNTVGLSHITDVIIYIVKRLSLGKKLCTMQEYYTITQSLRKWVYIQTVQKRISSSI